LTTAETGYSNPDLADVVRALWSGPVPTETTEAAVAYAIVRQSRWVVVCPWCPSALYAHSTDKRFFCVECGNAAVGGKWVKVEWPPNPEEIELSLSLRAVPHTRNWEVGETVADLAVENAEHGGDGASGLVIAR